MIKHTYSNEMASHTLRHRAVCEDDTYKGNWRTSIEDAYKDAELHMSIPGNESHNVRIITEQTLNMRYQGKEAK
jgi:hypothetical protein